MALLQLICHLLGLKNVCSGLSVAAMLCQNNAVKRVCTCCHRLMIWNKTCRLSAAAPALSSRRATSPSSSASSTASSGPPTSGSSTRRPSGSQEVLRYCCKALPYLLLVYFTPLLINKKNETFHCHFVTDQNDESWFKVGGPGNVETGEGEVSNWVNLTGG